MRSSCVLSNGLNLIDVENNEELKFILCYDRFHIRRRLKADDRNFDEADMKPKVIMSGYFMGIKSESDPHDSFSSQIINRRQHKNNVEKRFCSTSMKRGARPSVWRRRARGRGTGVSASAGGRP